MGIYNTFYYSDGLDAAVPQTLYGNPSKLEYSVEPFVCTAIGNETFTEVINGQNTSVIRPKIEITWANPSGTIFGLRLVRNQEGFSQTEEDGYIIYESFDVANLATSLFDQSFNIPITPGKYVYYTLWLLTPAKTWFPAGYDVILAPKSHTVKSPEGVELASSEYRFVDLLPRVYTTEQHSTVDEIDTTSDLFTFLSGFAYTLDETLTFADLLPYSTNGIDVNPNFVSVLAKQLGLPDLSNVSIRAQKRLIRQAMFIHKNKGTALGIGTVVESLSGFAPTLTLSPNIMLSIQDSTFYKSLGNWKTTTNDIALTAETDIAGPSGVTYATDRGWTAKAVTTDASQVISLGNDTPKITGIPITAEETYTLSYYAKATTGGSTHKVIPTVTWYDYTGAAVGTAYTSTGLETTTSWQKATESTVTAPAGAYFAGLEFELAVADTYRLDMVQFGLASDTRIADYYEAREIEIYLAPDKVNELENPSFADVVGDEDVDWIFTGFDGDPDYSETTDAPGIIDGSHMVALTTVAEDPFSIASHSYSILDDAFFTFSVYIRTGDEQQQALTLKLTAVDADGVTLEENGLPIQSSYTPNPIPGPEWKRYSTTLYVPNLSEDVFLIPSIEGTGDADGSVLYLDAAQLERSYNETDYFDGDYFGRGAEWVGLQNDSKSYCYTGKLAKLGNIKNYLPEFLPMNSAFSITTGLDTKMTLEYSAFTS